MHRVRTQLRLWSFTPTHRLSAESIEPPCDCEVHAGLAQPTDWNAPEHRERLSSLLSNDERGRLQRFRFDQDRLAFLVAHGLLRVALSRHAAVTPAEWDLRADSHGRPDITAPPSRLRFSLTHTRGLVACAVTSDRRVGIDVEDLTRTVPLEIADSHMSAEELRVLRAAAPPDVAPRLYEYWTLKEAYAKARGLGLSLPFDQLTFSRDADGTWRVAFGPTLTDEPSRWWFRTWTTGTHQVAVALRTR